VLEAVTEGQKLLLAEGGAEEGDTHGKVVSGKSRGHDQVRKTRQIGDVRRRCSGAWGAVSGGAASKAGRRVAVGYTIASILSAANRPSTVDRTNGRP
jgi:hypothetical protein